MDCEQLTGRMRQICRGESGLPAEVEAQYRAKWEADAEQRAAHVSQPKQHAKFRGLGDVVAAVTSAVGIKPCGPCKGRQAWLNAAVPFGKQS